MADEYQYEDEAFQPYEQEEPTNTDFDTSANVDELNSASDDKQNSFVVQPTNPPTSPAINDIWTDNSAVPFVNWIWDGTIWNKMTPTSAGEVGAYDTTTVDIAIGQVSEDTGAVSARTDIVEGKLQDGDGLFSTVSTGILYAQDRDGAVQAGVNGLVNGLQTDDGIAAKLPLFARQSDLTTTANSITAKFSSTGGVNLLKNSSAYAYTIGSGFLNWQVISGAVSQYLGTDCVDVGAGFSIATGTLRQTIVATAGKPYTLTLKVKKSSTGTVYVKMSDGTDPAPPEVDLGAGTAYDYTSVQIAGYIPQTGILYVELSATGATAVFTAIMLNVGTQGLQWSHAQGENYNGVVTFDINGIKVNNSQYNGYTVMSPQEFSGYYNGVQVFTLNKDVTQVAKLSVTDPNAEVNMGSVKALYVNNGTNRGWAFIPSGSS